MTKFLNDFLNLLNWECFVLTFFQSAYWSWYGLITFSVTILMKENFSQMKNLSSWKMLTFDIKLWAKNSWTTQIWLSIFLFFQVQCFYKKNDETKHWQKMKKLTFSASYKPRRNLKNSRSLVNLHGKIQYTHCFRTNAKSSKRANVSTGK